MNSVKKQKITSLQIILEKGQDSIWGRIECDDLLLVQEGKTVDLVTEGLKEQLIDYVENEGKESKFWKKLDITQLEFTYYYDLTQFFEYFDVFKISTFAKLSGINPSLLRKYASGITYPSEKQLNKIQIALDTLVTDLSKIKFI